MKLWNIHWKTRPPTKLHQIKNNVYDNHQILLDNRKDQVTLTRLRIGHTYITHQHLLTREDTPLCSQCLVTFSIKHILIDCPKFNTHRSNLKIRNQLKKILSDYNMFQKVLRLLKTIKLLDLI